MPGIYIIFFLFIILIIISNNIVFNQILCYERCWTCFAIGNSENHNCLTCKFDYHFLPNEDSTCVSREEAKLQGNFHVNEDTNKFEECYERCNACLDGNSEDAYHCTECKSGLYKITSEPLNCYYPYEININYYKDESMDPPLFKPCYDRCKTCSELGNDDNHKCDSCSISSSGEPYYKLDSGETGNCLLFEDIPSEYEIPLEEEIIKDGFPGPSNYTIIDNKFNNVGNFTKDKRYKDIKFIVPGPGQYKIPTSFDYIADYTRQSGNFNPIFKYV